MNATIDRTVQFYTAEQLARRAAWQSMLDMADKHVDSMPIVHPKTRDNAWQNERSARDLRTADHVFQTPFNQQSRKL